MDIHLCSLKLLININNTFLHIDIHKQRYEKELKVTENTGSLLSAAIDTQEYIGVRQSVSFAEVAVKNANTLKRKEYYQHHY